MGVAEKECEHKTCEGRSLLTVISERPHLREVDRSVNDGSASGRLNAGCVPGHIVDRADRPDSADVRIENTGVSGRTLRET